MIWDGQRVPSCYRAIHEAVELHHRDTLEREILEARLLTLQPYQRVAAVSATPAAVAKAYEHLFFAFRGQLQATDWMTVHAIRFGIPDNTVTIGAVLRKYAFWAGWDRLEEMVQVVKNIGPGSLAADLPEARSEQGRLERSIRLLLAIEILPDEVFRTPRRLALALRLAAAVRQPWQPVRAGSGQRVDQLARLLSHFRTSPAADGGWTLQIAHPAQAA